MQQGRQPYQAACSSSSPAPTTASSPHDPNTMSPAASSSPDRAPLSHHRKMKWTGLLSDDKLESLRSRFGHVVVCPGFAGIFGRKTDDWGRVFVPGGTDSHSEAKKIWSRWERECDNEKYSWWPEMMREKGIQPITCNEILDGISLSRWQDYRKSYARCRDARMHRRRRTRLRNEALDRADNDAPVDAAASLLRLGNA